MVRKDLPDLSTDRLDEAIDWQTRLSAPDANSGTWSDFVLWLEADPANRLAYDRVEDVYTELDRPGLRDVISVLPPTPDLGRLRPAPAKHRRLPVSAWIAGAALAAASLVLVFFPPASSPPPEAFQTRIGETRSVALADGTKIDIGPHSKLVVVWGVDARHVFLDRGEVIFRVAKDASRPFVVTVGDQDVHDIGTVFNVLRGSGATTITVAEGRVEVVPRNSFRPFDAIFLAPGDQLVRTDGISTVEHVDPAETLAWHQGYLIYRNAPLARVVSDLGRYFPTAIGFEGSAIASQRFSGVLRIDNEDAMLRRISRFLPVTIEHQSGGRITLRMSEVNH